MFSVDDLPPLIAHRGESANAPENTLAAIALAADAGAGWIELDINISADGVLFAHHDDTLERCTNGMGFLMGHTADELDRLDAGNKFGSAFAGEPIPRLSAVVDLLASRQLGFNLEIKPSAGWDEPVADAVCGFVEEQWPASVPLLISSFSERAVAVVQRKLPTVARGLITCAIPPNWREIAARYECSTFHCAAELLSETDATAIRHAGLGLLCWTVNDTGTRDRLLDWGVNSVFTDTPSTMMT